MYINKKDVVRHELVMQIVQAYENYNNYKPGDGQGENSDEPNGDK